MRKMLFFLSLLVFISYSLKAQNSFAEGFILTNQSDTTYGLIKYTALKDKEAAISFKTTRKGEVKILSVNEIVGFVLEGSRYFVARDFSLLYPISRKLFVEVLIRGELSLFKSSSGYYLEKNNKTSYLSHSPAFIDTYDLQDQIKLKAENDRSNLIKMATALAGGCNQSLIDKYGFKNSDRSLIKLVRAYNDCVGSEYIEYNKDTPWTALEIMVLGGVNSSSFSFSDNQNYDFIDRADFSYFKSIVVGAELKMTLPRVSKRVSFVLGAQYQKTNHYGFSNLNQGSSVSSYNDFLINTSLLRIPVGVGYDISLGNWPVTLNGGININRYLDFEYFRTEETLSSSQGVTVVLTKTNDDEIRVESNESGFWFGIGTRNKLTQKFDFGIQLRFEKNSSFTNISSNTRNFQILLSVIY